MIRVNKLSFSIGDFQLRQFDLEVARGEYFVLLGVPGSGKTMFLECLCGLKRIASGEVYIDGRDVTGLEPRERSVGYVPQDYALFPHLSVGLNIGFGLGNPGYNRKEISQKVSRTAEMLGIGHLLDRGVAGLSGGEKQRTALARALVMEPKVLLLDEPVCALDESTRQQICDMLRQLQRELGLTTIHVSHNLEEAFSVADKAGILHLGNLQQKGEMSQLLYEPKNEFVARFMRCANIFDGEAEENVSGCSIVRSGQVRLELSGLHRGRIKFMIRPEHVVLVRRKGDENPAKNEFPVGLVGSRNCGNYVRMELKGALDLVAHLSQRDFAEINAGAMTDLAVVLEREHIHVFAS